MTKVIISTFFIDLLFLILGLGVWFLCSVGKNAIVNNYRRYLTDDNIFIYSLRVFITNLRKSSSVIVKIFVIIFIIHSLCNLYDLLVNYVNENVNYETVPFLALVFDMVSSLFTFVSPFILPLIIAIAAIVFLYGFFTTMDQYALKADIKNDIVEATNENMVALYETNGSLAEEDVDYPYGAEKIPEPIEKRNDKKHHKGIFPPGSIRNFFNNSLIGFSKIAKFLPKIFLVVAVCVGANALFLNVKTIGVIVNNQKRINELNMTIKNLSRAEAVCEITLVNEIRLPDSPYPTKTYKISVLDNEGDPIDSQTQVFTLEGNQLAIDTMNINFDYSEISKGEHYNIAYPYRIHSDIVTSENGIPFECFNEDGTSYPVMYGLENSVVYSMDRNSYYQNLNEIFSIAKDEGKAAEYGIRSFVGQDIHEPIYKDETYRLIVTGTGGVKLSKVEHLDVEEDFSDEEISDIYVPDNDKDEAEKKGFFSTAKDKISNMFD